MCSNALAADADDQLADANPGARGRRIRLDRVDLERVASAPRPKARRRGTRAAREITIATHRAVVELDARWRVGHDRAAANRCARWLPIGSALTAVSLSHSSSRNLAIAGSPRCAAAPRSTRGCAWFSITADSQTRRLSTYSRANGSGPVPSSSQVRPEILVGGTSALISRNVYICAGWSLLASLTSGRRVQRRRVALIRAAAQPAGQHEE